MKKIFKIIPVFFFLLIAASQSSASSDGGKTSIYSVETLIIGGEVVTITSFEGCTGPPADCLVVTVTAPRVIRV